MQMNKTCFISKHFVGVCNGTASTTAFTIMKDLSLAKTGAKGEFLINKVRILNDNYLNNL